MSPLVKRTIPFMALLLFIVACITANPTTLPTEQIVPSRVAPTQMHPTAFPLPTQVSTLIPTEVPPTSAPQPPLGGSGVLIFGSNKDGDYMNIYLLDTSTKSVTQLTTNETNTFPGPFSPDSSKLLFTVFGLTNSSIGLMNADGTNPVLFTAPPNVDEGFPTWSPDGQQIIFTSLRDGNNEIYLMNADGTGVKRLTDDPADDFTPAMSPGGDLIAFVSDRDNPAGVNNLYLMHADGTGIVRLTYGNEIDYDPVWTPDANQIAFRGDVDGNADIYLINADGTGKVNLTNNPGSDWAPAWSPDGRFIAFQTNRDGNWEIYVMGFDGSSPTNLTQSTFDDQMPYWKPIRSGPDYALSLFIELRL